MGCLIWEIVRLVMVALRDVDDWPRAELVREKTEACLVGVVFGDDETKQSIAPVVQDADGNQIEQFERRCPRRGPC